jgi:hypothetical protein
MKCKLALVAKNVIIAQDTGFPSAINIFEGIQSSGFPLFIQELAFLTVWTKREGDREEQSGYPYCPTQWQRASQTTG